MPAASWASPASPPPSRRPAAPFIASGILLDRRHRRAEELHPAVPHRRRVRPARRPRHPPHPLRPLTPAAPSKDRHDRHRHPRPLRAPPRRPRHRRSSTAPELDRRERPGRLVAGRLRARAATAARSCRRQAASRCSCRGRSRRWLRASAPRCGCASPARTAPRRSGGSGRPSRLGCSRPLTGRRSWSARSTTRSRLSSCARGFETTAYRDHPSPRLRHRARGVPAGDSTALGSATTSSLPAGRRTSPGCGTTPTTSPT